MRCVQNVEWIQCWIVDNVTCHTLADIDTQSKLLIVEKIRQTTFYPPDDVNENDEIEFFDKSVDSKDTDTNTYHN